MATGVLLRLGFVIDRVVAIYSPDKGLTRHRSRQLLARAYEGASTKDGRKVPANPCIAFCG